MRWRGGALIGLAAVSVFLLAAAEDNADALQAGKNGLQAETNGDSSNAHSVAGKLEQHGEANHNKDDLLHGEGRSKKDTSEDNKDNPTEGTSIRRDEPIQEPKDKSDDSKKASQVRDFLQDPLIMECDPSHRCIIEKKKFIACLKVPGGDSLALSLLMDNKGMNPLDVSITAPDYVTLAQDNVRVEANDHNEVRFSTSDAANSTAIVLKVAEENCTISFHSAVTRETGRVMRMRLTSVYALVPVFVLLGAVAVCLKLRRMRKQDGDPAYHKLDTAELPVSAGGKKDHGQSNEWDENWGDDWDDEEAPLTPSKPMTKPSSKGLAPRRLAKDGWKDLLAK